MTSKQQDDYSVFGFFAYAKFFFSPRALSYTYGRHGDARPDGT